MAYCRLRFGYLKNIYDTFILSSRDISAFFILSPKIAIFRAVMKE